MHSRNSNTAEPHAITAMAQFGSLLSLVVIGAVSVDCVTSGVVVGVTGTATMTW